MIQVRFAVGLVALSTGTRAKELALAALHTAKKGNVRGGHDSCRNRDRGSDALANLFPIM